MKSPVSGTIYPISFKKTLYSSWLCSVFFLARCHSSICDCITSLLSNRALFLGPNSARIDSSEFQKCSGLISKPCRTSFSRKFFNSPETCIDFGSWFSDSAELVSVWVLKKETILFKIFMTKIIATLFNYPTRKNII